jgi:hypothetical protein
VTSQEDKEDKDAFLRALYDGSSTEVVFRHIATDTPHRVFANARAIGMSYCGLRILRSNSHEWVIAASEPVTCMLCLGAL